MLPKPLRIAAIYIAACFFSSAGYADTLPAFPHSGPPYSGPYLDPFSSAQMETVLPYSIGAIWWGATQDALFNVNQPWHWEAEFDINPGTSGTLALRIPGLPVIFGKLGPGPDLYIDLEQPDLGNSFQMFINHPVLGSGNFCLPSLGEQGSVCKQMVNLTPFTIAWGTAVTEGPPEAPKKLRGRFYDPWDFEVTLSNDQFNILEFTWDDTTSTMTLLGDPVVPEPSYFVVFCGIAAALLVRRAWRRTAPSGISTVRNSSR